MRVQFKTLFKLWVGVTLCLTAIFIFCFNAIYINGAEKDVKECVVEENMVGLANVEVIEKEVEIEVPIEKEVYKFPFKTEDLGTRMAKGVCNETMPTKEYRNMRSNEDVTVFANENTFSEGTLIWIEGVGIRQVQTVMTNENKLFVYFDSSDKANNFGEKEVRVFKVVE
jgi:3D (Asp-Asp-Asp) domain-containing protein